VSALFPALRRIASIERCRSRSANARRRVRCCEGVEASLAVEYVALRSMNSTIRFVWWLYHELTWFARVPSRCVENRNAVPCRTFSTWFDLAARSRGVTGECDLGWWRSLCRESRGCWWGSARDAARWGWGWFSPRQEGRREHATSSRCAADTRERGFQHASDRRIVTTPRELLHELHRGRRACVTSTALSSTRGIGAARVTVM